MVAYIEVTYSLLTYISNFLGSLCSRRQIISNVPAAPTGVGYRRGGALDRGVALRRPLVRSVSSQTLVSLTEFEPSVVEEEQEDELGWTAERVAEARWSGLEDRLDLSDCY